ncbi:MAG: four helix bundle protein [Leptospiraceae bacterium]|nr:four helix bundle protein [Leptospiraceae bacterium]MBK8394902.1 four helix bundle protein [Leptospiraceae bacterium]
MAQYQHLPIYKDAMDFIILLENSSNKMSKLHKYGIGEELRKKSYQVFSLIIRANSVQLKKDILEELRIVLEELKQFLFIAKEIHALPSFGVYKDLMLKLELVSKQNEGWLKSQKMKSNSQNS